MVQHVPFINYQKQLAGLRPELDQLLEDVIFRRSDFIMRDDLLRFEKNAAEFVGTKYAVGVKSCTDGLILSLRAAGIGPGDEVITVSHTFIATIASIHHVGATPVLVDINDEDLMDPDAVLDAITPKTRAIMPVHLNGRICDMMRINDIASSHNLLVLEDAAQGLGAKYHGQSGGSFGLVSSFSFFPAKLLGTLGDGGLVCTDDPEIEKKVRLLRDHGRVNKANDFAFFGFNSRLDNLQAAVLELKLRYLPTWLERRRELARIYFKELPDEIKLPPFDGEGRWDVFQNFVIKSARRDELAEYLRKSGVETLISWPKGVHENRHLFSKEYSLPKTERLCQEALSLPMNAELTDAEVRTVCKHVKEFYASVKSHA